MFNPPKFIGHRGVKNLAPENTLESIKLASKIGLKWVEIDVKITKDLVPILLHDDTLDRTTNGNGYPTISEYTKIKKLDAGCNFYNKTTKIFIPTLKDVLFFCEKNNICLNIELKPNLGFEKKNVEAVAKLMNKFNFSNQYYFSSFDLNSIILMKKLLPEATYGLLIDEFTKDISIKDILNICIKNDIVCCGFNIDIITSNIISIMKANNLITTAYSEINLNQNEAKNLFLRGVDSIFIDDPTDFDIF
jgi:glycerophosphoryl diester phosphodiesterase